MSTTCCEKEKLLLCLIPTSDPELFVVSCSQSEVGLFKILLVGCLTVEWPEVKPITSKLWVAHHNHQPIMTHRSCSLLFNKKRTHWEVKNGNRTLRHQDTSAPRQFGTAKLVPKCPDTWHQILYGDEVSYGHFRLVPNCLCVRSLLTFWRRRYFFQFQRPVVHWCFGMLIGRVFIPVKFMLIVLQSV